MKTGSLVVIGAAIVFALLQSDLSVADQTVPLVSKVTRTVIGVGRNGKNAEEDAREMARKLSGGQYTVISKRETGVDKSWDCTLVIEYTPSFTPLQLEIIKNKAPKFVIVSNLDEKQIKLITYVENNVPYPFESYVKKDGELVKKTTMIDRMVTQVEEKFLALNGCRITTASGDIVPKGELFRLKDKPAVLSADKDGIHDLYMQLLKSDTYVISILPDRK